MLDDIQLPDTIICALEQESPWLNFSVGSLLCCYLHQDIAEIFPNKVEIPKMRFPAGTTKKIFLNCTFSY